MSAANLYTVSIYYEKRILCQAANAYVGTVFKKTGKPGGIIYLKKLIFLYKI